MSEQEDKTPHPIDIAVGQNIRLRRRHLGIGQSELAGRLGVSFQQVQKYETGTVRISASRLFEVARVLRTPVAVFFPGLDDVEIEALVKDHEAKTIRLMGLAEGQELADLFPNILDPAVRRQVVDLVRALQEGASDGDVAG